MAQTPAEMVKEKLDIAEFLRGYLNLQPAGKNFKANCPFHKEKTPSFMISPERQTWHCFGCGEGGDAFSFLMKYENIEFGEALRILADRTGVELKRINPAEHKFAGLLFEINEQAKEFFVKQLKTAEVPRKYLANRKLSENTMENFAVGWAPNQPEALTYHLLKLGFRPEDLIQAGVSFKTERGMRLDRFRGRIMFPIHDHFGKVVGFTGRILPEFDNGQTGKYVNSPETPIFNKSKVLYGYFMSKNFIREKGEAYLVEGQMDFLMSWQSGVRHAIATSGTALTPDHLRALKRICDKIIVSFDTDSAGMEAGERAIAMAEANDFQVRVANLGKYKDPGDFGAEDPQGLCEAVQNARPAPEFYFDKYLGRETTPDPRSREYLKSLRAILVKLSNLSSPIERSYWLKELSKRTGASESSLREEMEKLEKPSSPQVKEESQAPQKAKPVSRRELLSQRILSAMLGRNNFELLGESAPHLALGYKDMVSLLKEGARRSGDAAVDVLLNLIVLRSEELSEEEIAELKKQLFQEYVKERRQELTTIIRRAESTNNEAILKEALGELSRLPSL